jgi:predicted transcriptional regulator
VRKLGPKRHKSSWQKSHLKSTRNSRAAYYHATPEELAGIDRGLKAAREQRFVTDQEVETVLTKRRGA